MFVRDPLHSFLLDGKMTTDLSPNKDAEVKEKLASLKRSRAGKKGSITKRVEQLKRIVSEGGSRTRLRYLLSCLLEVQKAVKLISSEILQLSGNDQADIAWLEDVNFTVDDCASEVHGYFEARKDDPESDPSMTESWAYKHASHIDLTSDKATDNGEDVGTDTFKKSDAFKGTEQQFPYMMDAVLGAGASATSETFAPTTSEVQFPVFSSSGIAYRPPAMASAFTSQRDPQTSTDSFWERRNDVLAPPRLSFPWNANVPSFSVSAPTYASTSARNSVRFSIPQNLSYTSTPASLGRGGVPSTVPYGVGSGSTQTSYAASWGGARPRTSTTAHVPVPGVLPNDVDAWIDVLDENRPSLPPNAGVNPMAPDVAMAFLVQQQLPRTQLPTFDGAPTMWVEFITKFRDVVHNQHYLDDSQRGLQLLQHLSGQPKRAVKQFRNDHRGYVLSLKRLKFLFGQKSKIAEATIQIVTKGKAIESNDLEGLTEFYYSVSDCLITLQQLRYDSDLYSSDTLRQAVARLPQWLLNKWAEFCLIIRGRSYEPNLVHFEEWLQKRVLAMKEAYLPERSVKAKKPLEGMTEKHHLKLTRTNGCCYCEANHVFWKCATFKAMPDPKKFDVVKEMRRCFNCLSNGHMSSQCKSSVTWCSPYDLT